MDALPFTKMHGLGNDFVVLDARRSPIRLNEAQTRAIADRHRGVGCDQLIVIEPAVNKLADVFMRIRNADGGEVAACGNASRCVAVLVMKEKATDHVVVETAAGLLDIESAGDGLITVDMGPARLDWRDIPLARPVDTAHIGVEVGPLKDAVAVNVGNSHAVFFVDDAEAVPLADVGPKIERHAMFPERANVEVVEVRSAGELRVRVWERGVGITQACGTGACASVVAAHRRGLTGRKATIRLDGGALTVEWLKDNHVLMTGPVATSFTGILHPSLLA
jgi:diaminopimelate epimerase